MLKIPLALVLLATSAGLCVAACTQTSAEPASMDAGSTDAPDAPIDAGDTDALVEAGAARVAPPPLPIIPNQGGPIVASPEVVSILWQGDPLASGLQAFDAWMVESAFWKDLMAEWGVGQGKYVGAVHIATPAPSVLADEDIRKLLSDGFAKGTIPPPNGRRIYTIYPPQGTEVTSFGASGCEAFQAYHDALDVTQPDAGAPVAALYAVTPRCPSGNMAPLDYTTWGQSHEVMEAASDPIATNPAWRIDTPSAATPEAGENADLCTGQPTRVDGFMVTRNWSNVAAKAGTRPCVPAPPGPMFGIFAEASELTLTRGKTTTVTIHAYATGPFEPFAIAAYPYDSALTVKLSESQAADGDTLTLTIKTPANWVETQPTNILALYASGKDGYTTKRALLLHSK